MELSFSTSFVKSDLTTLAKANLGLLKKESLKAFENEQSDWLYNQFQSHIYINGSSIPVTTTLVDALTTVNNSVAQENINLRRVSEILFGESGLLTLGKLALPLYSVTYSHGGVDSQNRHRLYSLGVLTKLLKGAVSKTHPEVASQYEEWLLSQGLSVLNLSYSVTPTKWYSGSKNPVLGRVGVETQKILDGLCTIHFNGSRTPSSGEKTMVKLSSLGVDIYDSSSIIGGVGSGSLDSKTAFALLCLNESYREGHALAIVPGCELTSGAEYARFAPEGLRNAYKSLFETVYKFQVGGINGNHVLRGPVVGCATLVPRVGKGGKTTTPTFNHAKHKVSPDLLLSTVEALISDQRTIHEWADLTGLALMDKLPPDAELSFFELAFQVLWTMNTNNLGNIGRVVGSAKTEHQAAWKLGNVVNYLLTALDDNDSLDCLFELEEEEEDEIESSPSDSDSSDDDDSDFDWDV